METGLCKDGLIVGVRQSIKALAKGGVTKAFVADDADGVVTKEFINGCIEKRIEIIHYKTMDDLGKDCGIEIGASVACQIKK